MDFGASLDGFNTSKNKDWGDVNSSLKDWLDKGRESALLGLKRDFLDGQDVLIGGNPDDCIAFNHQQGDNVLGFNGTCGLVSCEDVMKQHGLNVSENDVVWHALEHGECNFDSNPDFAGGTTPFDQVEILKDYGIDAKVEVGQNIYDLANTIESGKSAIIFVNAGVLWDDPRAYGTGESNHAIVPTGVVRDGHDLSKIIGFYINDSGTGVSKEFVPVQKFEEMWLRNGAGIAVTTFNQHPKF